MKKKLKIVLLAVAGLVILYHLMFVEIRLYDSKFNHLGEPDKMSSGYGDYFLFKVSKIDWGNSVFIPHRRIQFYPIYEKYAKAKIIFAEHAVLFRWNYYKLRQKIKSELLEEITKLNQFEDIEYNYDEEKMQLNIVEYEKINGEFVGLSKVRSDIFDSLRDKFNLLSRLYPEVGGICIDYLDEKFGMLKGQLEADYDKAELDLLNKLLINKLPKGNSEGRFDLKDTSQIRWTETEGTLNISWLDLRQYSSISGVMDLSKFKKMEYVSLEGLNLLMLQLPPALRYLDEHSVSHCKKIVSLEMPETLEYIDGAAFEGCNGLNEIVFKGDAPEVRGDKPLFEGIKNNVKIYYDKSKKGWTDKYWEQYELVPVKGKAVGRDQQKEQAEEEGITLSEALEEELAELGKILKKSKKKAPENLFQWDGIRLNDSQTAIKRLDLSAYPDISGELDLSVFEKLEYVSLKGLKVSNVILPESLSYLDADSFKNCEKIQQVTVPKNVKTMYSPAFAGCKSLKTVIFEGNAPDISNGHRVDDVFGKGMEKVQIYCGKNSKGWVESCWDKYEKVRFE